MEAMNDQDKPVHYTSKSEVCSHKARDTWTTTPSIIVHNDDEIHLSDSSDTSDTSDWDDHMLCDDEASLEAQLKAAQAAFRHSNRPDIVVPDDSGYDLRTINFNRCTFRGTGYFDVDDTGDYDPSECESVDLPYSRKGRRKRLHGKKKQRSKIVTLVFRNPTSIAHIKQLIEEQTAYESRSLQPNKPDLQQISLGNPLARGCKCCFSNEVECSLIKDSFDYPCRVCADSGDDCIRFIQPAMKDPCMHCSQEGIDCSFKSGFGLGREVCLQCEQAGTTCFAAAAGSIRIDDVFENPDKLRYSFIPSLGRPYVECHECRSTGQSCNLQMILDKTPCDNCSLSAATCTFEELSKDKHESVPSIHHNDVPRDPSSLFVTCEDVDEDVEMADMGFQPAEADPPAAEADPQVAKTDSDLVEAMYIKTSFCHPIAFNIPRGDDLGCDFCTGRNGLTGQYYATFGLGFDPLSSVELSPLVIPGKNGQGYQEISGGWQAWGKDFTRMCDACTFHRISILSCDQHEIRRMKDVDSEDEVPENILRIMVNMMQNVAQDIKFCSICPFPAFWECRTDPDPESSKPGSDDEGCGLQLCRVCASHLLRCDPPIHEIRRRGKSRGTRVDKNFTLDKLIAFARQNKLEYADGLRADVDFLRQDGELMTRQLASIPDSVSEDDLDPITFLQMSEAQRQAQALQAAKFRQAGGQKNISREWIDEKGRKFFEIDD